MIPRRRIIPVFIPHYGCKHDCVFCDQRRITGSSDNESGRLTPEGLAADTRPAELAFYGGSFTAMPIERQNELLRSAQSFLKLNALNSIRVSTRPDCIDGPTVSRLKACGVATIELGAQSMCDDVLAASRRGHTASDVARSSKTVKENGLALILQMMTGLPGDTRSKALYTARQFTRLGPDGVRIYPTVVVRGTGLYEMWKRGEYHEHTVDTAAGLCAEIVEIFNEADIPIIRLGLNPSRSLSGGDAVAGAYHPAFGELVYSRVYYNKALAMLDGIAPGRDVTIVVSTGCVSKMTGQRRCNANALSREFRLRSLKIVEGDLVSGEIIRIIC